MKRIVGVSLLALALTLVWGTPVLAAPNANASKVAICATSHGGQHVANCAQIMDQGVSTCATTPQSQCTL